MSSISCCVFLCLFVLLYDIGIKFDMIYDMIYDMFGSSEINENDCKCVVSFCVN